MGTPQDDDRGRDHGGAPADHVEHWRRIGGHAAHCGAMVGGMVSATVLTLLVIPAIFALIAEACLARAARGP